MKEALTRIITGNISPFRDPTLYFALILGLTPCVLNIDDPSSFYGYLTETSLMIIIFFYIICEIFPQILSFFEFGLPNDRVNIIDGKDNKILLSTQQYRIARWYLINGLVFHCLFDSLAGTYQLWSLMSSSYLVLDKRFLNPIGSNGMAASLVTQLEMFVMTPMCLVVYYGYRCHAIKSSSKSHSKKKNGSKEEEKKGKQRQLRPEVDHAAWVYVAEIITSTLQLVGTYFFYCGEIAHAYFDTGHHSSPIDLNLEFTFEHLFYFWFAFCLLPLVWVFVPLWMIRRAAKDLCLHFQR